MGQKHVAHEHNGGMSDQGIIVPALDSFCQLQVLFGHFEEHFNIPALAIDSDDVFVREIDIGRQQGKPVFLAAVSNKNQFGLVLIFERYDDTARIFALPRRFFSLR